MKSNGTSQGNKFKISWLMLVCCVFIITGVVFRFINLGKKLYWNDEAMHSVYQAGFTSPQIIQECFSNHEIAVSEFKKYEHLSPEKSDWDCITATAQEDPHNPPLYYLLSRYWMRIFGGTVAAQRAVSVIFGILMLPCMYYLALELFASQEIAWLSTALLAISPFHLLYAQEALPYSLWSLIILSSSLALLKALKSAKPNNWALYALIVAIGLYARPLFITILFGHGLYIALDKAVRSSRNLKAYSLSAAAAIISFLPWVLVMITNREMLMRRLSWTAQIPQSVWWAILTFVVNFIRIFLDLGERLYPIFTIFLIPILLLELSSLVYLAKKAAKPAVLFIATLMLPTLLVVLLPDLALGGVRSLVSRYMTPSYLGIELATAFLMASLLSSAKSWQKWAGITITMLLLVGGTLSCWQILTETYWWNKEWWNNPSNNYALDAARYINQSARPLVISTHNGSGLGPLFSLSETLDPKVKLLLFAPTTLPNIKDNSEDLFLFNPNNQLIIAIGATGKYKIMPIDPYNPHFLFHLTPIRR